MLGIIVEKIMIARAPYCTRTLNRKHKTNNKKTWIDKALMILRNTEHRCFNIWKNTGCEAAQRQYKKENIWVSRNLAIASQNYHIETFQQLSNSKNNQIL